MPGQVKIERMDGDLPGPQQRQPEPSYYDVSILQPPVWESHLVGPYFFFGGLAGGAFVLGRMAGLFGGREFRAIARAGSTVALLATLPTAPLLIKDLGDPSRFHHMLRVFKPQSPMNLGSWVLTGFGATAAAAVLREWERGDQTPTGGARKAIDQSLAVVTTAAGVPLALLMTCYTGVLLSSTATPVWAQNKWLAPLFAASAIGNGASAISLALEFMNMTSARRGRMHRALHRVDAAAHVAEITFLVQYLTSLGRLNKPLITGSAGAALASSVGAAVGSEVLKHTAPEGRRGRLARMVAAGLDLASGLILKYSILKAGDSSARDPHAARLSSQQRREAKTPLPPKAFRPIEKDTAKAGALPD